MSKRRFQVSVFRCQDKERFQASKRRFQVSGFRTDKLENGLLKLVESLERKRDRGDWIDHLVVKESNAAYGDD